MEAAINQSTNQSINKSIIYLGEEDGAVEVRLLVQRAQRVRQLREDRVHVRELDGHVLLNRVLERRGERRLHEVDGGDLRLGDDDLADGLQVRRARERHRADARAARRALARRAANPAAAEYTKDMLTDDFATGCILLLFGVVGALMGMLEALLPMPEHPLWPLCKVWR